MVSSGYGRLAAAGPCPRGNARLGVARPAAHDVYRARRLRHAGPGPGRHTRRAPRTQTRPFTDRRWVAAARARPARRPPRPQRRADQNVAGRVVTARRTGPFEFARHLRSVSARAHALSCASSGNRAACCGRSRHRHHSRREVFRPRPRSSHVRATVSTTTPARPRVLGVCTNLGLRRTLPLVRAVLTRAIASTTRTFAYVAAFAS